MYPGEIIPAAEPVPLNPGRPRVRLTVRNRADRPVQVGSHYHFAVANPGLEFDRDAAWGHRLDIAAGTAVRFEPGIEREVELVPIGGARTVPGLRPEFAGALDSVSFDATPLDHGRLRDVRLDTEDPERSGKESHD
ncbi:urease subunit beta [Actinopolyspora sp. H202]|uniref:urease subunit beta n=1 Tax=Actinopolyspora sp. H202 TaxID=1500456 RepID=UPI003EE78CCE